MDTESFFNILVIVLMVFLGAYFSATETAFSALNRIRIRSIAEGKSPRARRASLVLRLHDDFDKVLSTLLILNNLATLIAAGVSALLFVRYFGEDLGITLSTVALTVVMVFFADITPKSLAKESPEEFAMTCAPLLFFFVKVLSPANYLFIKWKSFLGKVFKGSDNRMTEDELYSIVEEARNDGLINEDNKQLLENAIDFKEFTAADILTSRMDIAAVSEDSSEEEVLQAFLQAGYSRLLVYKNSIDHIVGVISLWNFFNHREKKETSLADIFSTPIFVAPSIKIDELFKLLQKEASHIAVVVDEYGGTAGIVTMEDILEKLVGDIWDENDEIIVDFSPLGNNKHKVLCSAYVSDMFHYFGLDDNTEVESVGGWIMDNLRKVPEEGDTFTFEKLTITVSKTENRRALECVVTVSEDEGCANA